MKKNKLLAVAMLLVVFSSAFAFGMIMTHKQATATVTTPSVDSSSPVINPEAIGDPMGNYGILAQETATVFTADGNLTDWVTEGIAGEMIAGAMVYLAYDDNNVYVGLEVTDATNDITVAQWNKTGMHENGVDAIWELVDGEDDVFSVGFSNVTTDVVGDKVADFTDLWTWTASNRTNDDYAFETDAAGTADAGTLPYEMNTNGTDLSGNVKPLYDETWSAIGDYAAIPNGTMYNAWHDVQTTPTGSQTDVAVGTMYDAGSYKIEMVRALDTGNDDDFAIDFTEELMFHIGVANKNPAIEMSITVSNYFVGTTNAAADLSVDAVDATQSEALLVQGDVYDDYIGYDFYLEDDMWAAGTKGYPSVNDATGEWSYLFLYDQTNMPLGDHTVTVTFDPLYEDPLTETFNFTVVDEEAPSIEGMVDVASRYENGTVPVGEDVITVTVGLADNYFPTSSISAQLYHFKEDDVALAKPMVQFDPWSKTFTANFTIVHSDKGIFHNYTYYVTAWDSELNKATSERYTFISQPSVYTTEETVTTPGFGIIAGLFGVAAVAVFIKKKLE
jgi:hypothetical protein